MKKFLAILSTLLLSLGVAAQTGQVNHGGTGLNTAANNSILVGTGPNTYTLVAVPDCPDASGNHLNYSAGTYTITCGTSSTAGSGTPYQVTRYDSTGHALQDSTGSDNPANGPTRWSNGLSVEGNAGYRLFSNSPAGTSINLLACADASVNTVTQITTCPAGTNKTFGIVDTGAGVSGNARVAMIGFHAAIFDNQSAVNDFVAPSATNPGEVSDVGGSKPNNVQIIGKVTTVNSGAGTLATVDLFTGDTVAPGSSGGSGTVSSSCAGVAYYPSSGTTIVGDCLFLTDGAGHVTMYSLGLLDSTYAGFLYMKQGPLPPAAPDNTIEEFAPTSVTTYSIQKASVAGAAGECYQVVGTATDLNGHPIDQMGWGSCSGGGGGGSVTNFSSGNLSPLFTTSVANATTVPALTFSFSNAAANTIFGNFTGLSGAPSYNAISACGDSTHALSYVASTGFSCQAISSGASSVGLSINGGSSSGIFAITGSPVTSSGTLNTNTSGTSGGIPYFSTSSILSSSAALTANNPVLGGGAGSSPISGTRSGNTTEFGTVSGAVTSTHVAAWDASGNLVDGGSSTSATCPGASAGTTCQTTTILNDTSTGTLINVPVKYATRGFNESHVVKTQSADAGLGWSTGVVGICVAGCGTSGRATIAYAGTVRCDFPGAATQGQYVLISATNGHCGADVAEGLNEEPQIADFFARVHTTISGAGTTDVDIIPFGSYTTFDTGIVAPAGPFLMSGVAGSQTLSISPAFMDMEGGPATHDNPYLATFEGWRTRHANAFFDIRSNGGVLGSEAEIDLQGIAPLYGPVLRIADELHATKAASHYTPPDTNTNKSTGTGFEDDTRADTRVWTLTNDDAIGSFANPENGHWSQYKICQDGTGGRIFSGTMFLGLLPTVPAKASACLQFQALTIDATHIYISHERIDPVVATAQVAAITTTTLLTPQANSTWRITASLDCTTTSAAATVNVTIGWTDTSNTAQTTTLGSAVACAALGASSFGNLTTTFRAKSGTNITYATAIVNTPTYDLAVVPENLSAN